MSANKDKELSNPMLISRPRHVIHGSAQAVGALLQASLCAPLLLIITPCSMCKPESDLGRNYQPGFANLVSGLCLSASFVVKGPGIAATQLVRGILNTPWAIYSSLMGRVDEEEKVDEITKMLDTILSYGGTFLLFPEIQTMEGPLASLTPMYLQVGMPFPAIGTEALTKPIGRSTAPFTKWPSSFSHGIKIGTTAVVALPAAGAMTIVSSPSLSLMLGDLRKDMPMCRAFGQNTRLSAFLSGLFCGVALPVGGVLIGGVQIVRGAMCLPLDILCLAYPELDRMVLVVSFFKGLQADHDKESADAFVKDMFEWGGVFPKLAQRLRSEKSIVKSDILRLACAKVMDHCKPKSDFEVKEHLRKELSLQDQDVQVVKTLGAGSVAQVSHVKIFREVRSDQVAQVRPSVGDVIEVVAPDPLRKQYANQKGKIVKEDPESRQLQIELVHEDSKAGQLCWFGEEEVMKQGGSMVDVVMKMTWPEDEAKFIEDFQMFESLQSDFGNFGYIMSEKFAKFVRTVLAKKTEVLREFDLTHELRYSMKGKAMVEKWLPRVQETFAATALTRILLRQKVLLSPNRSASLENVNLDMSRAHMIEQLEAADLKNDTPLEFSIRVPDCTGHGKHVLEQEFVSGECLEFLSTASEKYFLTNEAGQKKMKDAFDAYMFGVVPVLGCMLLHDGFAHAEPHSGNLLYDHSTKTLTIIDWGATIQLSNPESLALSSVVKTVALGEIMWPPQKVEIEEAEKNFFGRSLGVDFWRYILCPNKYALFVRPDCDFDAQKETMDRDHINLCMELMVLASRMVQEADKFSVFHRMMLQTSLLSLWDSIVDVPPQGDEISPDGMDTRPGWFRAWAL